MCRMVVFTGACTRCGEAQTWTELSQELACLEAKNQGQFGDCTNGVLMDEHSFDQECDTCAEEDEGIGDVDIDLEPEPADAAMAQGSKRTAGDEQSAADNDRKKQRT